MYEHPFLLEGAASHRRRDQIRAAEHARLIRQARAAERDRRGVRQSRTTMFKRPAGETADNTRPRFLRPAWFMARISRLTA